MDIKIQNAVMKKFAVVLSGCGVFDGSEIHEATLSLLAIAQQGATYEIFAPDVEQHHVINHLNGEEMNETRNVLVESARIARGKIQPLENYSPSDFDALLFPGGFGAAKNLSSWAFDGPSATILPHVEKAVRDTISAGIPLGALCISPVILAKLLEGVQLTIGSDEATASGIESVGAVHVHTTHGEVVTDHKYKVVTTPCYMLDARIDQIMEGAENVVKALLELMD
jgi:enhancing lycopene biosynthesis protein 2